MHGDMGDWSGWGWTMMIVMTLFWIGFLGLIAWIAYAVVHPRQTSSTAGPLDLLKERYARGEISHDQFEQTKNDLASVR